MSHHAYFAAGDTGKGVEDALAYGERVLGLSDASPDIVVLRYAHLSVDDARGVCDILQRRSVDGGARLLIIATERLFHEAQNALLKSLEEPPEGTVIVLLVPSAGDLLPTVRSRLLPLPREASVVEGIGEEFASATPLARGKIVERILTRAKKDAPEEKQAARAEALALAEGLARAAYAAHTKAPRPELHALLSDLDRLIPVLHDRAAPLKPVLEHMLIVSPNRDTLGLT